VNVIVVVVMMVWVVVTTGLDDTTDMIILGTVDITATRVSECERVEQAPEPYRQEVVEAYPQLIALGTQCR